MTAQGFDPLGPLFISYRQSDGTAIADELTWRLRTAGVPVWRDTSDLLPGSTTTRLQEALESGLAGAVLVVTPEVAESKVVKTIEAPRLVELAADTKFAFAIANAVTSATGPDYMAPDRLLQITGVRLSDQMQYAVNDPAQVRRLVEGVRTVRVGNVADVVADSAGVFTVHVQTRNVGQVHDRSDAQLDIRVKPPTGRRRPDHDGLNFFADAAAGLPAAVTRGGATSLVIRGGAHLSIALALGCLFPSTRIARMEVEDHQGNRWVGLADTADGEPRDYLNMRSIAGANDGPVGVYVDLSDERSDAAFDAFVADNADTFSVFTHVTSSKTGRLNTDASATAVAVATTIRRLSYSHSNAEVHLLYRGPFGLAPLLGRKLNTIRSVLYEWEDLDGPSRYVPTLVCTPSNVHAPVRALD